MEKDYYLLQLKKNMDVAKDKKFLMLKYEDIEKLNDHLQKEKDFLMKELDQHKVIMNKKQLEIDEVIKQNNMLQEKERLLL